MNFTWRQEQTYYIFIHHIHTSEQSVYKYIFGIVLLILLLKTNQTIQHFEQQQQ